MKNSRRLQVSSEAAKKLDENRKKMGCCKIPVTSKLKELRACMICSMIKSEEEFRDEGCDNCNRYLRRVADGRLEIADYTSAVFEGMIALIDPKTSWVAKWQRLFYLKPGVYAVNVRGTLSSWVKEALEEADVAYINRDVTERSKPEVQPEPELQPESEPLPEPEPEPEKDVAEEEELIDVETVD